MSLSFSDQLYLSKVTKCTSKHFQMATKDMILGAGSQGISFHYYFLNSKIYTDLSDKQKAYVVATKL